MLINYLQPVVKEMLKGWLLSPGGGGERRTFPGQYREASPERCAFFRLSGDGRFTMTTFRATKRYVALRWCEWLRLCSNIKTLSTTTVLFRTKFTRTIILNLLMKWPLGSIFNICTLCCAENRHCKFLTLPSGLWLAQGSLALHKN